jgi:hypothetical protein
MTPDIDAGFAQIARQRIVHAPLRYYVWLPIKRAIALWFVPHAQYYPFEGELFPLEERDHENYQDFWLPIFFLLTPVTPSSALQEHGFYGRRTGAPVGIPFAGCCSPHS